jgi:hypothetical protein
VAVLKRIILAIGVVTLASSVESLSAVRDQQRTTGPVATGVPQDPSAVGYLNLHKRHPDADEGPAEFATAYSADAALQRLSQVQGFLTSFRRLTDRTRRTVAATELTAIGNTSADMQTIGFHNIPLIVEGTLLKQDYQLRQAQYELAQLKRARGEISAADLNRARDAYAKATKRLQVFWDTRLSTD